MKLKEKTGEIEGSVRLAGIGQLHVKSAYRLLKQGLSQLGGGEAAAASGAGGKGERGRAYIQIGGDSKRAR